MGWAGLGWDPEAGLQRPPALIHPTPPPPERAESRVHGKGRESVGREEDQGERGILVISASVQWVIWCTYGRDRSVCAGTCVFMGLSGVGACLEFG